MGLSDERVAKTDVMFREANERILQSAREHDMTDAIPFLCECPNPACTAIIRLSDEEFHRIRGDSKRFFNAPGHSERFGDILEVVESHPTYEVVARVTAPRRAEQLDPPGRT